MTICTHTLVRNEERYVWYSVMSVINHVDRLMLWDMMSTDNTYIILKHIKAAYPDKVYLKQTDTDDTNKFTALRQQMLDETKEDWVILVDGDEVWWDGGIKTLTNLVRNSNQRMETVVSRYVNAIGDIYHFQDENASHYKIDGLVGNITIRAMSRNIPGLHYDKPHGTQGVFDKDGTLIQEREKIKREHLGETSYMHFTHLPRSSTRALDAKVSKRSMKYKHELGIPFPNDFYYPEVFFRKRPNIVPSVWDKRDTFYLLRAIVETYPKAVRRKLFKLPEGY